MATGTGRREPKARSVDDGARAGKQRASRLTSQRVWHEIGRASFAVIGYVTPAGEPRSSGVVYGSTGKRLYTLVAPDSWKAKHIAASGKVSVVVPVRRGGILSLLFPIPPACISFHAAATVHPAGSIDIARLPKDLASTVPRERLATGRLVELVPEGDFRRSPSWLATSDRGRVRAGRLSLDGRPPRTAGLERRLGAAGLGTSEAASPAVTPRDRRRPAR